MSLKLLLAVLALVLLLHRGSGQSCVSPSSFIVQTVSASKECLGVSNEITATFSYRYSSVGGNPVWQGTADGEPLCTESFSNQTIAGSIISGIVVASCRRSGNADWSIGEHQVTLKVTYEGVFPCAGGIEFATALTEVLAQPQIAIAAPLVPLELCPGIRTIKLTYRGQAGQGAFAGELLHSAVLNDNIPCSTAAETGSNQVVSAITVTCSTEDPNGFPQGSHSLTLQVSAANQTLSGCSRPPPVTAKATVNIFGRPKLSLIPVPRQQAICYNSRSMTARFNYRVREGGSQPVLRNIRVTPQFQGDNVQATVASRVNCTHDLRAASSTHGQLLVTCSGNFAALKATSIDINTQMTATCGMGTLGTRSAGSSSSGGNLGRRMLALPAEADSSAEEDELFGTPGHGGNSQWQYDTSTVEDDAGMMQIATADSTIITETISAAASSPSIVTRKASIVQEFSCCFSSAVAYAKANRNSVCYKHVLPGSGNRCPRAEGYYNRGPTSEAGMFVIPQTANLGKTTVRADCNGRVFAGPVVAECVGRSIMEISVESRRTDQILRTLIYVGCNPPAANQCPANSQWVSAGTPVARDDPDYRYVTMNIEVPTGCTCNTAYWAVYATGDFRGMAMGDCIV